MKRSDRGQWLPGCPSPNPSGRPKGAIRRIRDLCLQSAEEVVRELIQIALDRRERAHDRIAACNALLDRALGRASADVLADDDEPTDLKERILRLMHPELKQQLGWARSSNSPSSLPEAPTDEDTAS